MLRTRIIHIENAKSKLITNIQAWLVQNLQPKRLEHTYRVMSLAVDLASIHKADESQVYLAALLHDCAKNFSQEHTQEIFKECNVTLDIHTQRNPSLWHAIAGEHVAEEIFGVNDPEVHSAIRKHTTGDGDMSVVEMIIYVADYIDPIGAFNNESIYNTATENLAHAVGLCAESSIQYLLSKKKEIHPNTLACYNKYLAN